MVIDTREDLKGAIYCILWYFSIWTGFLFICCPLLPFVLLFPKTFFPVMSVAFSVWEMYPVALMKIICGTKIVMSGDFINSRETSIIISNHRTRVDWNFLWAAMYFGCHPRAHRLKMILKSDVRHTPSLGWVMQVAGFLYIKRNWLEDKNTMKNHLNYYKDIGHIFQILLFPEGTDLTDNALTKSDKFADEHNVSRYKYVLHPRTTGFVYLAETMRQNKHLDAVYDISLGYPDVIPYTEIDVFRGNFPKEVHFHVNRYSVNKIGETDEDIKSWLVERWSEKENSLSEFYKGNKFANARTSIMDNALYFSFVFWTLLQLIMFYEIIYSNPFRWWTFLNTSLFVILSFVSNGVQSIAVSLYPFVQTKKSQ